MSQETNHEALDQGPACTDWHLLFPLGITVPLAAHCIEQWFNTEHISVLDSLLQARKQSDEAKIAINTLRPNSRRGWSFSYRSVDFDAGEFMPFSDQLDRLKGLSETDGGLGGWAEGRPGGEASEPDPHDGLTEGAPDGLPE